jgi:heme/copper-type cytochrome/quinol oxidase subunit 1
VSWYTLVPRQAGGKLFSDPMARTAFILFLVLSTPIGIHHQYMDPGIHQGWKLLHALLTFAVFFPSLLTFFNVVASLEMAGRARGATGWLDWFAKLPWGDPSVAAQVLAMVLFAFGGIGGLINASFNVNMVVHNTAYIVGHLHLTVGTAVTLTFMGITYWLVPHLAGRALWSPRCSRSGSRSCPWWESAARSSSRARCSTSSTWRSRWSPRAAPSSRRWSSRKRCRGRITPRRSWIAGGPGWCWPRS